jgi:hypothetical protein
MKPMGIGSLFSQEQWENSMDNHDSEVLMKPMGIGSLFSPYSISISLSAVLYSGGYLVHMENPNYFVQIECC